MCRGLDEQVQAFRERPLDGAYPYLWLDAKVEKVREPGGVRQKALVVAYAVHESGIREVIGLDVGEADRSVLDRISVLAHSPRPLRRPVVRLRRPPRPEGSDRPRPRGGCASRRAAGFLTRGGGAQGQRTARRSAGWTPCCASRGAKQQNAFRGTAIRHSVSRSSHVT